MLLLGQGGMAEVLPQVSRWRPGEVFLQTKMHHLGLETLEGKKPDKNQQNEAKSEASLQERNKRRC